jgi:hypothetical protein
MRERRRLYLPANRGSIGNFSGERTSLSIERHERRWLYLPTDRGRTRNSRGEKNEITRRETQTKAIVSR